MTDEDKKPTSFTKKIIVGLFSFSAIGLIIQQTIVKEVATASWGYLSAQIVNYFQDRPGLNPVPTDSLEQGEDKKLPKNCWETYFSKEDLEGWDFSPYKKDGDGFYKANPLTYINYWAPEIWLKKEIKTAFSELEFRSEVRSGDNASTLIIAFGKEPKKLLRFRVGDGNPQVVTFGRIVPIPGSSSYGFEPLSPARTLTHPIKKGSSSVVTIKTKYDGGDDLSYNFIVSYHSNDPKDGQIDDPFNYTIELPDANPVSRGGIFEKTYFGFAVYKTASIRPLYFRICPFSVD